MEKYQDIDDRIIKAQRELTELDERRIRLQKKIEELSKYKTERLSTDRHTLRISEGTVSYTSLESEKIALFRNLFKGREDVYPKRFESKRTGKSGYQPVCRKEWIKPFCQKPKIKCGECENRDFAQVNDDVIRNHLLGVDPKDSYHREYVIGVYPMLPDETCWFLSADFDEANWTADIKAYIDTCRAFNVPASVERSRSGKGGHIWIFFSEPIHARIARFMGAFLLTETMSQRPEIGFDSYDRFIPTQDTIPKGGFGNLIALPLQGKAREKGNSVFLDDHFEPFIDQWQFLSSIRRMKKTEVENILEKANQRSGILGVPFVQTEEDDVDPWLEPPSRIRKEPEIIGPFPNNIEIVLGNQVYIPKADLPPSLTNRLIRIAAFQNPEFYKAQAMRFSTYGKPRVVNCSEDFPKHIGLPRGCLDNVIHLLESLKIQYDIKDKRMKGNPISTRFIGELRPEQLSAAEIMLKYDTGVLSASTAFGKTVIAAYLISQRKVNTLIVVHLRQLLDQWMEKLKVFLDIPYEHIGQIGGSKRKPTGIIDVCMMQSLNRKGVVDDIVGDYGYLIVDECHHVSASSFESVARQCQAKYVTGLTATAIRKDGHHPIIYMNCGPVRYKVNDKKQAAERPFEHKVVVRETDFTLPNVIDLGKNSTINDIYSALIDDEKRNQMIIEDIFSVYKNGQSSIILTERKEHLYRLYDLLSDGIPDLIVLKGGMGKKQKKAAMDQIQKNSEKPITLLATGRYLGEGFDDSRLDTLFLTLPVSWKGILTQYAGRLHRVHDMKKEVVIFDYADLKVPVLSRMHHRRLTGYKAIGYEIMM